MLEGLGLVFQPRRQSILSSTIEAALPLEAELPTCLMGLVSIYDCVSRGRRLLDELTHMLVRDDV